MMILKEVVKKEVNFLMKGFRMWVNSLGIEDLHINNLYEDGGVNVSALIKDTPRMIEELNEGDLLYIPKRFLHDVER